MLSNNTRYAVPIALVAVLGFAAVGCRAFQPKGHLSRPPIVRCPTKLCASKEQEIAELEERLAQLKAEEEAAAVSADEDMEIPPLTNAPDDGFDMNAYKKRVANIKDPPPGEFLSEAWKESVEEQPGLGDTLKTLGIGLGVILALIAFSQVPIGDDGLAKYSDKIGL